MARSIDEAVTVHVGAERGHSLWSNIERSGMDVAIELVDDRIRINEAMVRQNPSRAHRLDELYVVRHLLLSLRGARE